MQRRRSPTGGPRVAATAKGYDPTDQRGPRAVKWRRVCSKYVFLLGKRIPNLHSPKYAFFNLKAHFVFCRTEIRFLR